MQYIEVIYLDRMQFVSRKLKEYEGNEIEIMFKRTIGKLTQENKSALVAIRDSEHQLIKSELLK